MSTGRPGLIVRGPYRGFSGHDHHVRQFVRHLARAGIALQLEDLPHWSPGKLTEAQRDPWFDGLAASVEARAALHFCMPHQVQPTPGLLHVNYTMFEATRVPLRWVALGARHARVVVPNAFCEAAWVDSGLPPERLRVCPLGVDAERFHPDVEPLDLVDAGRRPVREYRTRVLNVSELGPRKNLPGLLRVWIRATTPRDDAILIVKIAGASPAGLLKLLRDLDAVERDLGRTRRDAAPVVFVNQVFSDAEMPHLYAAATHYWSLSHGEAWDQPMMEAGATGLALIAPRHSAYPGYLDDSVATLIPARRVPVRLGPGSEHAPLFAGADWWEPDEGAAIAAIRAAVAGADRPIRSARARLAAGFTWDQATARLVAVLREVYQERGLDLGTG